jgi:hypothetical protein
MPFDRLQQSAAVLLHINGGMIVDVLAIIDGGAASIIRAISSLSRNPIP